MDIQGFHNAVNIVLTVVLVIELIDVKCHPAVTQNMVESIVILPNQLSKKTVFLLRFRNLSVQMCIRDRVTISDAGVDPVVQDSLFFREHLEEDDKYPVFLDGNHGLVKIENQSAPKGSLLIVKDSFAPVSYTHLDVYKRQVLHRTVHL